MSHRFIRRCVVVCLLCVVTLFVAHPSAVQISAQTGAVRVVVVDSSGASVVGAKVTLSSKISQSVIKTTGDDGTVVFPLVTPGSYTLETEQANFKRALLSDVQVAVTEVTNLRVALELGQVNTELQVSADAVQTVNTTNATMGNVLTGDVLHNLPLSTQNFTFLLALNAATSAPLPDATQAGLGTAVVYVDGQRGTENNLVIDGIDANNIANNNLSSVPIPSPDSLEELRVQTLFVAEDLHRFYAGGADGGNEGGRCGHD